VPENKEGFGSAERLRGKAVDVCIAMAFRAFRMG
jgi:hypothetical protein